MTYKERLIELLQHSPTDAMGNHGVGAMADHLMDNGLVFKELYEDMEERIAHQRVRAETDYGYYDYNWHGVHCVDCGAYVCTAEDGSQEAIEAWNRRAEDGTDCNL